MIDDHGEETFRVVQNLKYALKNNVNVDHGPVTKEKTIKWIAFFVVFYFAKRGGTLENFKHPIATCGQSARRPHSSIPLLQGDVQPLAYFLVRAQFVSSTLPSVTGHPTPFLVWSVITSSPLEKSKPYPNASGFALDGTGGRAANSSKTTSRATQNACFVNERGHLGRAS